jgi:hypothetical protein
MEKIYRYRIPYFATLIFMLAASFVTFIGIFMFKIISLAYLIPVIWISGFGIFIYQLFIRFVCRPKIIVTDDMLILPRSLWYCGRYEIPLNEIEELRGCFGRKFNNSVLKTVTAVPVYEFAQILSAIGYTYWGESNLFITWQGKLFQLSERQFTFFSSGNKYFIEFARTFLNNLALKNPKLAGPCQTARGQLMLEYMEIKSKSNPFIVIVSIPIIAYALFIAYQMVTGTLDENGSFARWAQHYEAHHTLFNNRF